MRSQSVPESGPGLSRIVAGMSTSVVSASVRRALAPPDYMRGIVDLTHGIPGNGEAQVKLFVDASATTQAGYRLYLFFP